MLHLESDYSKSLQPGCLFSALLFFCACSLPFLYFPLNVLRRDRKVKPNPEKKKKKKFRLKNPLSAEIPIIGKNK